MIDLTGGSLIAYLLRVIRDIVERHPRFKSTLGTVTFPANAAIAWRDTQVVIRSVTASGNRLSPDYFICTQQGRAILAKVADKPGQLVEWVREIDPSRQTPEAGVYYVNVDYLNEQTNDIGLTCQQFKWKEGKIIDAEGSQVFFRAGMIDPGTDGVVDLTTLTAEDSALEFGALFGQAFGGGTIASAVDFIAFNQSFGGFMNLLSPVDQLVLKFSNGIPLVPHVDYWYERQRTSVLCQQTTGGQEAFFLPSYLNQSGFIIPYRSFTITDQDGYVLRTNIDYVAINSVEGFVIQLADWSPSGSTLYCNATIKLDPSTVTGTNPENIIQLDLQPGESLAPGQVFIHTTAGDFPNQSAASDGTITLPVLMQPGEYSRWEVRIETPQVKASAKKWELNSLVIVDPATIEFKQAPAQPGETPLNPMQVSTGEPRLVNGQQQYFLPGLQLAIGDQVIVGDQVAVIVSPTLTETYEVFGSKENISFTLEVKANDLQTASDLSEMLKQQLLIMGRENNEADGLTIFEATRDFQGMQRDLSATAPTYTYNVSVTASADWKVFVPLVTRMVQYEIIGNFSKPDFQGKLQMANRMQALGATQFITNYR